MIVDLPGPDLWCEKTQRRVAANFDDRRFLWNGELNLVVDETGFNAELATQFETELFDVRTATSSA